MGTIDYADPYHDKRLHQRGVHNHPWGAPETEEKGALSVARIDTERCGDHCANLIRNCAQAMREVVETQEGLLGRAEDTLDNLLDYVGQLERRVFPSSIDAAWEVTEATSVLQDIVKHRKER